MKGTQWTVWYSTWLLNSQSPRLELTRVHIWICSSHQLVLKQQWYLKAIALDKRYVDCRESLLGLLKKCCSISIRCNATTVISIFVKLFKRQTFLALIDQRNKTWSFKLYSFRSRQHFIGKLKEGRGCCSHTWSGVLVGPARWICSN